MGPYPLRSTMLDLPVGANCVRPRAFEERPCGDCENFLLSPPAARGSYAAGVALKIYMSFSSVRFAERQKREDPEGKSGRVSWTLLAAKQEVSSKTETASARRRRSVSVKKNKKLPGVRQVSRPSHRLGEDVQSSSEILSKWKIHHNFIHLSLRHQASFAFKPQV